MALRRRTPRTRTTPVPAGPTPPGALAGLRVDPLRSGELLARVDEALRERRGLLVTSLNPDYARRALLDPALRDAVNAFDLVLVDGNGVRVAAALSGFRVPERLDTDSVGPLVLDLVAARGGGVHLFGCAPGVAERAAARLLERHPGLRVVGVEHGYHDVQRGHPGRFAPEDAERLAREAAASGADLVVVSLPTPLQQRWVVDHAAILRGRVVMTAGSWLDHVAERGSAPQAWYPWWARVLRLHWAYRLLRSPRTLWRRYTVEALEFFVLVWRLRASTTPVAPTPWTPALRA